MIQKLIEFPSFAINFTRWKLGFCRRLRKHDPVVIFQMGKVGSQSIHRPLNRIYPGEVIHAHVLSTEYPQGEVKELMRYINSASPPEHLFIISPIRNPFDRNISAFFQNFESYTGQDPEKITLSLEEVQQIFIREFPHELPIQWLQNSIQDRFQVDLFAEPFPEHGWKSYKGEKVDILILRCELENRDKTKAVNCFLDRDDFEMGEINVTSQKGYHHFYSEFKRTLVMPDSIVNKLCDSDYFSHFYPAEDIEVARKRWSGGTSP